jgi:hypothetical protein
MNFRGFYYLFPIDPYHFWFSSNIEDRFNPPINASIYYFRRYLGCSFRLLALFFYLSVNFPFQDDFLLIQFVEPFSRGYVGVQDFFYELFRTFNDHKPVIPRLISTAEYFIRGHLNFRLYTVLILVNITLIFYFLYAQFRKTDLKYYYFLPVPFCFSSHSIMMLPDER